jgi:hypothetical protein
MERPVKPNEFEYIKDTIEFDMSDRFIKLSDVLNKLLPCDVDYSQVELCIWNNNTILVKFQERVRVIGYDKLLDEYKDKMFLYREWLREEFAKVCSEIANLR